MPPPLLPPPPLMRPSPSSSSSWAHTAYAVSPYYMLLAALLTLPATLLKTAPYGRYSPAANPSSSSSPAAGKRSVWRWTLDGRLSWMIFESPGVFIPIWGLLTHDYHGSVRAKTVLCFYLTHYIHRALIYPLFRMSVTGSAPMPVAITMLGLLFCAWNAWQQTLALQYDSKSTATTAAMSGVDCIRFVVGMIVAVAGMSLNIWADRELIKLKNERERSVNERMEEDEYRMPTGRMFKYVSCPNYAAEIMEWCGWAMAAWSMAAFSFAVYTMANVIPRAIAHHRRYRKAFGERYPRARKAIIPFVL